MSTGKTTAEKKTGKTFHVKITYDEAAVEQQAKAVEEIVGVGVAHGDDIVDVTEEQLIALHRALGVGNVEII